MRRTSKANMRVVVVGSGLSGLSTAAFLRRFNIQCVVLEQAPHLHSMYQPPVPLWSNALTCFRAFEMGGLVDGDGRAPEEYFGIKDSKGKWMQKVPNLDMQLPTMGEDELPPSSIGPRATDYTETSRYIAKLSKVTLANVPTRATYSMRYIKKYLRTFVPDVRFGKRVVDLVPISDYHDKRGGVHVVCADGDIIAADVVVGADGARSMIRKLVYPDQAATEAKTQGLTLVDGYTNIETPPANLGTQPCEYWGNRKTLNCYPLYHEGQNRVAFTATLFDTPKELTVNLDEMTLGEIRTLYRALLKKEFGEFGDEVCEMLGNATVAVPNEVVTVPIMPQWHNRRAVLTGDAAHGIFPSFLGQDASLAVEDAAMLATAINAIQEKKSDIIEHRFTQFERSRRRRVEQYIRASNRARSLTCANWEGGRNMLLKCTPWPVWAAKQRWLTEWSYSHGQLYNDPDVTGDASWKARYSGVE